MSERLTKRKDYGCACWNGDQNLTTHRRYLEMLDAMAKYEDVIFDADGNEVISLARLRELAEAERDGRLVVLPCKRGTTFFAVNKDRGYIYEQDYDYPEVILVENRRNGKSGNRGYTFLDKGKKTKIYLSRAEAERALAATEPKGDATCKNND